MFFSLDANFAFSPPFGYNTFMQKSLLLFFASLSLSIPLFLSAAGGYIGENPGLDFYSKIDEGTYKIQKRLVSLELAKSPTLASFGQRCGAGARYLTWAQMNENILRDLQAQNYSSLTALLRGRNITTTEFHTLATCLANKYSSIQSEVAVEQAQREEVASLGLYFDGDRWNSDYDILYDIEKINEIIFTREIKYTGTNNIASTSLLALLNGRPPAPVVPDIAALVSATLPISPSPTTPTPTPAPTPTVTDVIGDVCVAPGAINIDPEDSSFATELWSLVGSATSSSPAPGFAAGMTPSTGTGTSPTKDDDFFHTMPCSAGSSFCIDIKMVPGESWRLTWGTNVSIESLVDKFTKHILPISESSLAYQQMTNNAGSLPIKNLKLWKTLGGLRVYLQEKPQPTRRDKNEATPEREKDELKAILGCAYTAAGLPTDTASANSIAWAGFRKTSGNTTADVIGEVTPLGTQESIELARTQGCMRQYMREGRQTFYNSFSTDLTEIQAYTVSMLAEVRDIMAILEPMNTKPVK
jgi:hypothetical protein